MHEKLYNTKQTNLKHEKVLFLFYIINLYINVVHDDVFLQMIR